MIGADAKGDREWRVTNRHVRLPGCLHFFVVAHLLSAIPATLPETVVGSHASTCCAVGRVTEGWALIMACRGR